jgi:hypothetical protein
MLDGYQGDLVVGGREYIDGVILADQRNPSRALCVTSFLCDLNRDDAGDWAGRLRPRLQIGMACWLVIMVAWIAAAAVLFAGSDAPVTTGVAARPGAKVPTRAAPITAAPGEVVTVNGANENKAIVCNGNQVTVNGSAETVHITGRCLSLTVSGSANRVDVRRRRGHHHRVGHHLPRRLTADQQRRSIQHRPARLTGEPGSLTRSRQPVRERTPRARPHRVDACRPWPPQWITPAR